MLIIIFKLYLQKGLHWKGHWARWSFNSKIFNLFFKALHLVH